MLMLAYMTSKALTEYYAMVESGTKLISKISRSPVLLTGPQVKLLRPGAAGLDMQLPVRLRNCIWRYRCILSQAWPHLPDAGGVNQAVHYHVGAMYALQARKKVDL